MKTMTRRRLIIFLMAGVLFYPLMGRASTPVQSEVLDAYLKAFPEVKSIGVIYSQPRYEQTIVRLSESAKQK